MNSYDDIANGAQYIMDVCKVSVHWPDEKEDWIQGKVSMPDGWSVIVKGDKLNGC